RIHADPRGRKDFILADAKDPDMALSIGAPGRSPESHPGEVKYRSLAEFRDVVVQIVEQGMVDVMLMSASTSEVLTIHRRLFDDSPVTPAARANDTTDVPIVRTLGGVTSKGRPIFLKMVYHGPKAMEELVHYDPHLVVGILGGSAGTTYDAFKLLAEAKKYGARVALFGRKINNAENQLAFV